jgi:hypothetical protein
MEPSKTDWEAVRLETYGSQSSRKTKTTMARRFHARSRKAESKKLEGGSQGWKNLERLGCEGENPQRVVVSNNNGDDDYDDDGDDDFLYCQSNIQSPCLHAGQVSKPMTSDRQPDFIQLL